MSYKLSSMPLRILKVLKGPGMVVVVVTIYKKEPPEAGEKFHEDNPLIKSCIQKSVVSRYILGSGNLDFRGSP